MIYFILQRDSGKGDRVKIGTTKSPASLNKRLKTFATGNPDELTLLHLQRGDRFEESRLHRTFQNLRIGKTEWFRYDGNLWLYLRKVTRIER